MTRFICLTAAALLCGGCLNDDALPEAPVDLDAALHQLWSQYDVVPDADVRSQARVMGSAADLGGEMPKRFNLRRLEVGELAAVMMRADADPSTARGTLMVNTFACTLERLEKILTALNQQEVYGYTYDTFAREYSSDVEAYGARTWPTLGWVTSYEAKLNDAPYAAVTHGTIRYVPAASGEIGPLLLARTWLPEPAQFFDDKGDAYPQDYQVELFWERSPGEIAHFYGVWREMKLVTANLSSNDDTLINLMVDRLRQWDTRTEEICKK